MGARSRDHRLVGTNPVAIIESIEKIGPTLSAKKNGGRVRFYLIAFVANMKTTKAAHVARWRHQADLSTYGLTVSGEPYIPELGGAIDAELGNTLLGVPYFRLIGAAEEGACNKHCRRNADRHCELGYFRKEESQ